MIRGVSKVLSRQAFSRFAVAPVRSASAATFAEKERGEESRYFAREDADKLAAMKAKFEAVVSKGDVEEIEELMETLGTYN
jgi:hypothetical protein